MRDTTTVTTKYQVTILKQFRSNLEAGDILRIEKKNGTWILKKVEKG